jgi:Fe-S cluster biogenesis protein NfuA
MVPQGSKHKEDAMKEKVEAALKKIRPMLQRDGGNVELIEVEDGIVKVRLQGACAGCPMSQMTIKNGIERLLKQEIPEVKSVVSV